MCFAIQTAVDDLNRPDICHLLSRPFALLVNRASIDQRVHRSSDLIHARFPGFLKWLVTPQHGMFGQQQANMVETDHGVDLVNNLPILSLYSETRRLLPQVLEDIDCLVIDLQDVGTRVYTYIWTLMYCLQDCAKAGKSVVIFDRPNPVTGLYCEGPLLDPAFRSFVGEAAIPMRHGLTIAEMADFLNRTQAIGADISVVPMTGWKRSMWFDDTDRHWIPPSPNMPTIQTATVYPGQVLLEGTNLSEGRGTTFPFEVVGAPYVNAEKLAHDMNALALEGVRFLPTYFTPAFDKWRDCSCAGVSIHVTDRNVFQSYAMTVHLIATCAGLWPSDFRFNDPPYEYETVKPPIDIISGSDELRNAISEGHMELDAVIGHYNCPAAPNWHPVLEEVLIYDVH
ncbi:MAG: DUF1343 domain-containing protein [Planctomycetaceae bacterium]